MANRLGAQSVCAQTVSPIAKHLIAGYMCSSGSIVSNATPVTLKESERLGEELDSQEWLDKY